MQYQALYRKYRPQRFDEVVGQDHVVTTLAREVVEDKVAHAYLFTGPRGTGKTTSARLLAKSLNCPNRADDGEPCNTCPSCVGITEGTSFDVIELDAASHNKVEDVREIRANVSTVAAAEGAKRVYILDEAHMLSRAAGNALLKTLEEPPEHVVFVLATTEPYKVLDTIRSRSQRFDFLPVATETLIDYLAEIAGREQFRYDHAALNAITSHAGGSVRDAMSLLEQVAALGAGSVTSEGIERALGLADRTSFRQLAEAIIANDAAAGLTLIASLARRGTDLRRFVADAIAYFRGVFLTQYAGNVDEIVDASKETMAEWSSVASTISSPEVLRSIDELSDALVQMRDGREERLVVELTVLRLTRPEVSADLESVSARLSSTERAVRELQREGPAAHREPAPPETQEETLDPGRPFSGVETPSTTVAEVPPTPDPRRETSALAPSDAAALSGTMADESDRSSNSEASPAEESAFTLADFERIWPSVVAYVRTDVGPRRHALLREATPVAVDRGTVTFEVDAHMHFHLEQLKADKDLSDAMARAASEQLGRPVRIVYRSAADPGPLTESTPDRAPDIDDLFEAGESDDSDPTRTMVDLLGAEVISDTSKD
ncbi:MAG TPA: DNA polymerase III subunit gamma/tau [Acidimicrobiia bacterium]|nr:DNA polymerase III subunit gamma/tau [Acidimicrobiia bacterium]